MPLSLSTVNLITLTIGTLFYGVYLVLFSISLYLLVQRYKMLNTLHNSSQFRSIFKSIVFAPAVCLFVVVTVHWITIVYQAFLLFVAFPQGPEGKAIFNNRMHATEVAQDTLMIIAILVGDSLIIHRLWVVSRTKLVLAVPVASLTAFANPEVSGFISLRIVLRSADIFSDPLLKVTSVLTLLTNLYCTGELVPQTNVNQLESSTAFITWKIWTVTKAAMPSDGTKLRHFVIIVIESAGIYSIWVVFFAVTFQVQSNLQSSIIQTGPALIGLVNALIHTRVGLGWTSEQTEKEAAIALADTICGR
ncbi:hypothetical protein MSAN_01074100 [Mycena sanguinolenta]|uniref:Uncharacterized protein n=1 Tax=Mycena sanguinolenta TaxID=230812 RepID=A0A8H7D6J4_9AGAR|nr:hypothetical protein MSAN_01074100 [Mycena sanguinolenta]